MQKTFHSKSLLVSLLSLSALSAVASDFYVVAPMPGKQQLINGISVALSTTPLPNGVVGVPYAGFSLSSALQVSGDPAYSSTYVGWSVVAGALPAGLTLNKGVISGTPTAAGAQTFTVRATYKTKTGEQAYQLFTYAVSVALATGVLPQGVAGVAYPTYDLKPLLAVQGDPAFNPANVTWTVVANSLPAGLTLKADGTISGTPTVSGTGSVTARASYKGVNGEQTYQVVTLGITVNLAPDTLAQGVVGVAYPTYDLKSRLTISGDPSVNPALVTWTVVSNTLPTGLTLKADGTIAGTPTTSGTGAVTARASYKGVNGEQTYQVVTLGITVNLATATLPQGIVGQLYNYDAKPLLGVGGDAAYTGANVAWSVASGTLPAGLALNAATGVLSGTPTAASSGNVVLRASYKGVNGEQTYQVVTLNIVVSLASATLPGALAGSAYSYDFKPLVSASGDPAFNASLAAFDLSSGAIPPGMALSAAGNLTGTPTTATAGTALQVRATYKMKTGVQSYNWVVTSPTGQAAYTLPGTYTFTAPAGVTSVSVVAVGGGGSGYYLPGDTSMFGTPGVGTGSGGGGGLGWKNNIAVVPGQNYTVVVGVGGAASVAGNVGLPSYFIASNVVAGLGGGSSTYLGAGGSYVGHGGGAGGDAPVNDYNAGGGGAGGYAGKGGSGTGGSGGNGRWNTATFVTMGSGGGVGIYGQGASGANGTTAGGGSGGAPGVDGAYPTGGAFGGGGAYYFYLTSGTAGAGGAVRIIWGPGRAFPATLTTDR